ncbi:MAG: hypothetical protein U0905_06050 [Pirellulales bacterium]
MATVRLLYRKFDQEYMQYVYEKRKADDNPIEGLTPQGSGADMVVRNDLPIMTLASDTVTFPIKGVDEAISNLNRRSQVGNDGTIMASGYSWKAKPN